MANMSYCRFHNTLQDLYDCQSALEEFIQNGENEISSAEERREAKRLIELCKDIADSFEPEDIDRASEEMGDHDGEEDDDSEE